MKNKLAFGTVIAVVLALFFTAFGVFANTSVHSANAEYSYSDTDIFEINSTEDFYSFYDFAITGEYGFSGKTIRLNADIDGSKLDTTKRFSSFGGTFDGNGHKIYSLRGALFSYISQTGVIKNVEFANVDLYGYGVAEHNGGLISNVSVSGTMRASTQSGGASGIVSANGANGIIENCSDFCEFVSSFRGAKYSGIALSNMGHIENSVFSGKFIAEFSYNVAGISWNNTGSIENSVVMADYDLTAGEGTQGIDYFYAIARDTGNVGTVSNTVAFINNLAPNKRINICNGTVNAVQAVVAVNGEKRYYDTVDGSISLTAETLGFENLPEFILEGEGTEDEPFLISDFSDLRKLKITSAVGEFFYALNADIDLKGREVISSFDNFTCYGGTVYGKGHALWNGCSETVFSSDFALTGENVGFVLCEGTLSGNTSDGYIDWHTDFGKTDTESEVTSGQLEGNGTRANPYVIDSAESLKAMDGLTGYALVTKDIAVNDFSATRKLNLTEIKAEINGNGKVIVGLTEEPLCETLSGKIYNLTLRGLGSSVCKTLSGNMQNVTVLGTGTYGLTEKNDGIISECIVYGEYESAFFVENNGTLAKSVNYATAEKVFSYDGTGTIENSVNYYEVAENHSDGVDFSFDFGNSCYFADGEKFTVSEFDYLSLKTAGFDFTNVFGYEKGSNEPVLRKFTGEYKTEIKVIVNNFSSMTYSAERSYYLSQINRAVTTTDTDIYDNTEFSWTYDGEQFFDNAEEVGLYELTARYNGSDDYLPSVEKMSFSILKADFEEFEPIFAEGEFADITETYSGEFVELPTPVPANMEELSAYGFTQSYLLKQDGKIVSGGLNVGTYEYCAVFTSKNYNDIVISVDLKIEKKELSIKVRDAFCDYNSAFDTTRGSAFIVDGLVKIDENKTLEGLAKDYVNGFSSDYKVGDNVGDYAITFTGVADNYFFTVTDGTLHIRAIPIPLDIIDFYGATLSENGSYSVEYSGEPVVLTATCPDYVTVSYSDNSFVDVCTETVSATFEINENYERVVLRVNLEIYKATVTVKAPSLSVIYGKNIELSDLTAEVTGLKGESVTDVFEEFSFECYDGETVIAGIYNAGTYSVKTAVQPEPKNYFVEYEDGILTIEKASLKTYRTATASETFVDGEKIYDGESAERKVDFFDETEAEVVYSITKGGSIVGEIRNAGIYTVVAKVIPSGDLAVNYKETEYSCTYTVNKKSYDLQFSQTQYDFVYGGISYADITNFPYSGLEDGAETVFIIKKDNSTVNDIFHFGSYDITVIFNETENENSAQANAKVTVAKKDAEVSILDRYDYIGERIEPVVISITGGINDELTEEDLRFGYRNITGLPISYIRNAGRYYVDISLTNEDYRLLKTEHEVTVDKAVVPFAIGTITYPYGTQGETDINGTNMIISDNSVYIPSYRYGEGIYEVTLAVGKNADAYVITDKDITDMTNFDFVPEGENKVIVTRRSLTLAWLVDGNEYSDNAYTTLYLGEEQKGRYGYKVQNLCYGEKQEELSLSLTVNGSDSVSVYDVGEYLFEVKLTGSLNYTLANSPFTVTVEKEKLFFSVNDAEVYQWESFRLSYEVAGAVGNDKNKSVSALKGAQIRAVTSYNENSPVNSVHSVTVRASFYNYDVEVVREGTIIVVTNPYEDYLAAPYWKDTVTVVYTGKNITVEINNLPEGVTAVYSNNIQRDAGTYTVSATVTYPTGRQKSATCLLTIVSANPTVSVSDEQMLFIENYVLTEADFHGVATFDGERIEGDFIPAEGQVLALGTAQYEFTFIPRDTKNFNTAQGTFAITSASITLADFTFDGEKFDLNGDGVLTIDEELRMNFHPPIDGLTLCRNGSEVEYVIFDKSETVAVTVTLGDKTAFEMTFTVVLEEKSQPVVIDMGVLELTSVRVSGKNIFVFEGGGRMSVNAKHKDNFLLYVNGNFYEEFIFDGREKEVDVTIILKTTGKPVFSETYNVSIERIEQEKKSYTLYYVIGGSVLGVIAIIAVVLFIWKKRNG